MTQARRPGADLDVRRRRLLFRSWHRGTREMDLVLGRFADAALATLGDGEIDAFESLLEVPDPDLFAWLTGAAGVPAVSDTTVWRKLVAFHCGAAPR